MCKNKRAARGWKFSLVHTQLKSAPSTYVAKWVHIRVNGTAKAEQLNKGKSFERGERSHSNKLVSVTLAEHPTRDGICPLEVGTAGLPCHVDEKVGWSLRE